MRKKFMIVLLASSGMYCDLIFIMDGQNSPTQASKAQNPRSWSNQQKRCSLLSHWKVDAFPMTVMFGMCSIFLFIACLLQRRLMAISDKPKSEDRASMKERDSEAEPLNI
ncbi:molybdate-anion transporter-like [Pyrus ussuriensis x Pyrus communis]|uniref:Molybdate-anion transporter-like n=1 Tax=Pyrus ussuriensis x Pyrus communis TaxID=2448454 RepID=A0A5N5FCG3_9ROSA|nr:molybdate-anion transporter-like [Pyrus ussuriensis x Pyrus communis]